MNPHAPKKPSTERYELKQSPLAQHPTQRDLAILVGSTKGRLEALATNKDVYTIRRQEEIGGKVRNLAYPFGKLRGIHERLKFHLNKVRQPDYLLSPRKGRSQRDNALVHVGQRQYLKLDIKQFYPSTTDEHIYRWARYTLGMFDDVAGLFTRLATVDGRASFGSPLTPVLVSLVHRKMFDAIYDECRMRGLRLSVWVDDLVISGDFVPGILVDRIRDIVRANGLRTHKLHYLTGSREVVITGIPVRGSDLTAPRALHRRIEQGYRDLNEAEDSAGARRALDRLLSALGTYRHIVGGSSPDGRRAANKMNSTRLRRRALREAELHNLPVSNASGGEAGVEGDAPF